MSGSIEYPHAESVETVFEKLGADEDGLSEQEATARRDKFGPNTLEEVDRPGPFRRLLRQFHDVLIYILIVAAGLTAYLQEWIDTGVILAVVILNAAIGFIQEGKAEEALEEIRQMLTASAAVFRDGERRRVDAEALVPGDVIWLEAGDRVPADARLVDANDLRIEEAILTGESEPVAKATDAVAEDAPLGDRRSMVFSGTVVVRGTAKAVVVATGNTTEIGRIGEMVAGVEQLKTPLLRKIDRFGFWLSAAILAVAGLLFVFGWVARPYGFAELMMLVVSLSVAAIPEGLPAIMTITLALGVRRMADRNAIIRKLPAVETLGSVTVICSDKTGTLTRNEMSARQVATKRGKYQVVADGKQLGGGLDIDGRHVEFGDDPEVTALVRAAALCNDARIVDSDDPAGWTVDGEPTEAALVVLASRAGMDRNAEQKNYERLDTVPFDSERRYMATLHDDPDRGRVVFLKGAPETVLSMCDCERTDGGRKPLDAERWHAIGDELAGEGYRMLAIAERVVDDDTDEVFAEDIGAEFVFLGLAAMMDPPRPEAIEAVGQARRAGIQVKMITGDHAKTACSIGGRINLEKIHPAVTGQQIEEADDEQLTDLVVDHDVFARTSPEHKLRIVKALQQRREIVAMTGDGVNDSPALKRADVGIAMGIKGTEATKQAADMVLADDNFASIERAIHEGRTVYDNLKKTILFLLPTNGAEALMIMAAVVLALEHLPITPVQILWVNMITAVTLALALAFEPPESNVMERPPRPPGEPIIDAYGVVRVVGIGVLIGAMSLGSFFWAKDTGMSIDFARTAAVNILVSGQLFYLFSSRFLDESAYLPRRLFANPVALYAAGALVVAQLIFTYTPPFQLWFGTEGLTPQYWLWVGLAGLVVFAVVEFEKAVRRRFGAQRRR